MTARRGAEDGAGSVVGRTVAPAVEPGDDAPPWFIGRPGAG